jgi:hypothetical protein
MSTEEETKDAAVATAQADDIPDMSLLSITDGENERGIPVVKFIDDVGAFVESFTPPASAELLIGAYTELHSKFKTYEISLTQKRELFGGVCGCDVLRVCCRLVPVFFVCRFASDWLLLVSY